MNPYCEICGVLRNLDPHHVIPKRMGGSKDPAVHDEGNVMTLCRSCHRILPGILGYVKVLECHT